MASIPPDSFGNQPINPYGQDIPVMGVAPMAQANMGGVYRPSEFKTSQSNSGISQDQARQKDPAPSNKSGLSILNSISAYNKLFGDGGIFGKGKGGKDLTGGMNPADFEALPEGEFGAYDPNAMSEYLGGGEGVGFGESAGEGMGEAAAGMGEGLGSAGGGEAAGGSSAGTVAGWIGAGMLANDDAYDNGHHPGKEDQNIDPASYYTGEMAKGLGFDDRSASTISGSALSQSVFDNLGIKL
jgi:hypothetical protein